MANTVAFAAAAIVASVRYAPQLLAFSLLHAN
jgi:hypothetical protein